MSETKIYWILLSLYMHIFIYKSMKHHNFLLVEYSDVYLCSDVRIPADNLPADILPSLIQVSSFRYNTALLWRSLNTTTFKGRASPRSLGCSGATKCSHGSLEVVRWQRTNWVLPSWYETCPFYNKSLAVLCGRDYEDPLLWRGLSHMSGRSFVPISMCRRVNQACAVKCVTVLPAIWPCLTRAKKKR